MLHNLIFIIHVVIQYIVGKEPWIPGQTLELNIQGIQTNHTLSGAHLAYLYKTEKCDFGGTGPRFGLISPQIPSSKI